MSKNKRNTVFAIYLAASLAALPAMGGANLFELIKQGNIQAVAKAIEADSSLVNKVVPYHSLPLVMAVDYHKPDIVKLLLDKGANPNAADPRSKRTPMLALVQSCGRQPDIFCKMFEMLAEKKVDVNALDPSTGWPPVMTLATYDYYTMKHVEETKREIDALLKKGAKINHRGSKARPILVNSFIHFKYDKEKNAPLMAMMKFLIEKGAKVDDEDENKSTLLIYVLKTDKQGWPEDAKVELIKYLISKKANLNKKNKQRESPKSILRKNKELYNKVKGKK